MGNKQGAFTSVTALSPTRRQERRGEASCGVKQMKSVRKGGFRRVKTKFGQKTIVVRGAFLKRTPKKK
jgi:hypothetical protein